MFAHWDSKESLSADKFSRFRNNMYTIKDFKKFDPSKYDVVAFKQSNKNVLCKNMVHKFGIEEGFEFTENCLFLRPYGEEYVVPYKNVIGIKDDYVIVDCIEFNNQLNTELFDDSLIVLYFREEHIDKAEQLLNIYKGN